MALDLTRRQAIQRDILVTLNYYNFLGDLSLTAIELNHFLINLSGESRQLNYYHEFIPELKELVKQGKVFENDGFFSINPDNFSQRLNHYKISLLKKKKLRRYLKFILWWPTVRAIALSGSLDLDNAQQESDWDILVICQPGTIWLTRLGVATISHFLRRRRYDHKIKDRFCWNYFLVNKELPAARQTFGQAEIVARWMPLFGKDEFDSFWQKNCHWIKRFLPNFRWSNRQNIWLMDDCLFVKTERLLGKLFFFLSWGESIFRYWQRKRIQRKIKGLEVRPNYLYLSDDLLVFHYPPSRSVLAEERTLAVELSDKNNK